MDLSLGGKSVVVTAGGSNINRAIALLFAQCGAKVAVFDIDMPGAEATAATAKANGGTALAIQADVTSPESLQKALAETEKAHGPVEVFVSGVGWAADGLFLDKKRAHMEKEVNINLWGTINCVQAVLPGMAERGKGSIITIASDAGRVGEFRESVYSACKAGTIAFMKALAKEYGPKGVRFNAVCPGMTNPTVDDLSPTMKTGGKDGGPRDRRVSTPDSLLKRIERAYPLRRTGKAQDVASAVVFLGSDAASFVTGQTLSVSGGYSMM